MPVPPVAAAPPPPLPPQPAASGSSASDDPPQRRGAGRPLFAHVGWLLPASVARAAVGRAVTPLTRSPAAERRHLALEVPRQLGRRELQADVEGPELRVPGRGLVEAHLVDQLLEDERVVGEQVDAPLPVVEADRARDHLRDLRPRTGGRSSRGRASCARGPRPAPRTSSAARRGACSSGRSRRSGAPAPRGTAGRATRVRCSSISASKALLELLAAGRRGPRSPSRRWMSAVISYMPSSTTETKEVVGSRKGARPSRATAVCACLQLLEAAAEVHQHQVALVAEHRGHDGRALGAALHAGERLRGLRGARGAVGRRAARASRSSAGGTSGAGRSSPRASPGLWDRAWDTLYTLLTGTSTRLYRLDAAGVYIRPPSAKNGSSRPDRAVRPLPVSSRPHEAPP